MAVTITGEYTSSTALRVKATGLTNGTRYRLFVESFTSGSSDGTWYCLFAANMDSSGTIDWRSWSGLGYNGRRSVRLYYGTNGSYDAGKYYSTLPSNPYYSGSVPAYTPPQETYTIHFNDSPGISSFTYTTNGGSTVHSTAPPSTITFGTTKGYLTFQSITLESGYSYPITATADVGVTSWTVQTSSSSFVDAQVSCVDVSGKTSNIRNVTLSASQNWYGLDMDTDEGVSGFKGYTVSQGSGTEGSYTSIYRTSSSSSEKFYFTDITPKTGYTYPIYATDGTNTWTVKSGPNSTDWNDHYVSYSSVAGEYRQVSLYATKIVTYYYRREYSANGGSYTNNPRDLSSQNTTNNPASISINVSSTYLPHRDGYYFRGYYLYLKNAGSSTETYIGSTDADDTSFSVTFNYTGTQASPNYIQLYARWEEIPTYTYKISFNANRGTGAPSPVSYGPTRDTSAQLAIPSETPTRSGYSFKGWALNATTGSPIVAQPNTGYWLYSSEPQITMYAQWDQLYYGRVQYHLEGGSMMGSVLDIYNGPPRSRVGQGTYPDTIIGITPTKSGYTFYRWGSAASKLAADQWDPMDPITINCNSTSEDSPTNNHVYAIWDLGIPTYYGRIKYLGNNGTPATAYGVTKSGQPPIATIASVYVRDTIKSTYPTRTGYTCIGWSNSSSATTADWKAGDDFDVLCASTDSTSPTEDQNTIYAVWKANKYTITFNANGGTPTPTPKRDDYDTSFSLTPYSNGVRRAGHTLLGWSTNQSATTPTYGVNANYTIKGDATLYAIWSSNQIDKFYWVSSSTDANYFDVNDLEENVLTYTHWNNLKAKIKEVAEAQGNTYNYTAVTPWEGIAYSEFNDVRSAIAGLSGHGTLPSAVSYKTQLKGSQFNGSGSLKNALNTAIDNL